MANETVKEKTDKLLKGLKDVGISKSLQDAAKKWLAAMNIPVKK
jgi:hypothetical protein